MLALKFENVEDIKRLPEHLREKLFELDPGLKALVYPYKFTGIDVIDFNSFRVIIHDVEFTTFSIKEFEYEVNPNIKKVWREYLEFCLYAGGRDTSPYTMPHDMQKEIFKMLGLERIFIDERESGKYNYLAQDILKDLYEEE